jgi:hypothetical protein
MRSKTIATVLLVLLLAAVSGFAQDRGKAEATVKGKKITIDYGRPALQGRDMIGMAKAGQVWRLGMNEATEIQTNGTLVVGGKELKPGKYSLWAKKTGDTQWVLGFHPETGLWGDPAKTSGYIAELPLKLEKATSSAEQLNINVADKAGEAAITIRWGTSQLTGNLGVK